MKPLSDKALRDLLPKAKQYKLFVGKGLYILVRPNGSKYWRLDYRFAGKRFTLSLGVYPNVSLKVALANREAILTTLKSGINPKDKFLNEKQAVKDKLSKQLKPTRYLIESDGGLHIRLGNKVVYLDAVEVIELRRFLESTKLVNLPEV